MLQYYPRFPRPLLPKGTYTEQVASIPLAFRIVFERSISIESSQSRQRFTTLYITHTLKFCITAKNINRHPLYRFDFK